ncbi:MAG: folylpolyglutamate synthase/dihydrofolate synthase family protein, partial [Candidatus Omnitrophota bacterium]
MTYRETLKYLDSFIDYEKAAVERYGKDFRIQRTERLLSSLGDPQKGIRTIHIAGTKGKGSTAAFIASILKESGLNAGLYTSPHLVSFRERITINGRMIDEEALARIITRAKPHFEEFRDEGLSFFEIYTAVAFLYFKERGVDVSVIETGLGGRLDATNTAQSAVSVITPISLEHTRILGSTLYQIAREKAGIIKRGSVCVSGPQEAEALDAVKEACVQADCRFYLVGRDIIADSTGFEREREYFNVRTPLREYRDLETGLMGVHQVVNAATAIGAVEAFGESGAHSSHDAVRRGIANTEWPGRMEIVGRDPFIVLDGAQNEASAKVLIGGMKRCFGERAFTLILGISSDKEIGSVCKVLSAQAHRVLLTRAKTPRAADPQMLRKYISDRP